MYNIVFIWFIRLYNLCEKNATDLRDCSELYYVGSLQFVQKYRIAMDSRDYSKLYCTTVLGSVRTDV